MADCPGVLHLAVMADGGLARIRIPGGTLSAAQARAIAEAAGRLGSGEIDLTNRANLQIRGLDLGAGSALAAALAESGLGVAGEAERRRNILLDPYSGLDPGETADLRPLARALEAGIVAAPWIGSLSPKFSFALDGGGRTGLGATPSDVVALASAEGVSLHVGAHPPRLARTDEDAASAMLALAAAAARRGPDARAADLSPAEVAFALAGCADEASNERLPAGVRPRFGAVPTRKPGFVAATLAVPVGRLDAAMLAFLADAAERDGEGVVRLAPWSAAVIPGVRAARAVDLFASAEAAGFTPIAVARRLSVTACAGAPACERAIEPAKALGREILRLAANAPSPEGAPRRLHLSACPKGCAGSRPADLLLLGSSERAGWSLHADASPRRPGASIGRLERPSAQDVLSRLDANG